MALRSVKPLVKGLVRPYGDRLLVKRLPEPDKAGPLILPGNMAQVHLARGSILEVGPKVPAHHALAAGEVVRYPRHMGYSKVSLNGEEVEFIPVEQVYAVER